MDSRGPTVTLWASIYARNMLKIEGRKRTRILWWKLYEDLHEKNGHGDLPCVFYIQFPDDVHLSSKEIFAQTGVSDSANEKLHLVPAGAKETYDDTNLRLIFKADCHYDLYQRSFTLFSSPFCTPFLPHFLPISYHIYTVFSTTFYPPFPPTDSVLQTLQRHISTRKSTLVELT